MHLQGTNLYCNNEILLQAETNLTLVTIRCKKKKKKPRQPSIYIIILQSVASSVVIHRKNDYDIFENTAKLENFKKFYLPPL